MHEYSLMTEDEIKNRIREKVLGNSPVKKKYTYKITFHSDELREVAGLPSMVLTVHSNKSDIELVKKKIKRKADLMNEMYRKGKHSEPEGEGVWLPSQRVLDVCAKIPYTRFKLIFNKGTDTTTTAIIGSSFAAGKTTIMMNAILPAYYGARVTEAKRAKGKSVYSKRVASPASLSNDVKPAKMIKYINILFSINSHIKAYKGYIDLVSVTGFDQSQQQIVKDVHMINVKTDNKYRFALFIDDILETRHSKPLSQCFMTYRNAEISTCLCTQYLFRLNKDVRGNIQNLIFCKLLSEEAIKGVVDTYLGSYFNRMGVPKDLHVDFYRCVTDKFHFIHLHQGTGKIRFCLPIPLKK